MLLASDALGTERNQGGGGCSSHRMRKGPNVTNVAAVDAPRTGCSIGAERNQGGGGCSSDAQGAERKQGGSSGCSSHRML